MADAGNLETNALLSELDGQRAHVLGTLEGLSDESLRRPVLPSGWTCLGLVQHLALDVERFWFYGIVAGQTNETADSDTPQRHISRAMLGPRAPDPRVCEVGPSG